MRVRMLATAAGPDGVWAINSVQVLPDDKAAELIAAGCAVSIEVREQPDISAREMAINPKAATRGTRRNAKGA